ncbi:MAG: polysaccharide deacetylase family protein [Acidobacteriota bacterium]
MPCLSLHRLSLLCLLGILFFPTTNLALPNSAKVPVLIYHSWNVGSDCSYVNNAPAALESDLETIRQQGFVVVPLYWIAEWAVGIRDGSTLPDKVVGLTFDDGVSGDWYDNASSPCGYVKSFRTILQEFKARYPDLPWYSPHAAVFVVGSPSARQFVGGNTMTDEWWAAANSSGIMEIYNHSTDHDHESIHGQYGPSFPAAFDSSLGIYIPVAGYGMDAYNWVGRNNFFRIDSYLEANYEIARSAQYISSKIGVWPDLFAYPFGHEVPYLINDYFPNYPGEHQTLAAFCCGDSFVTRNSSRYCLPRFSHGSPGGWTTPAGLVSILQRAQ